MVGTPARTRRLKSSKSSTPSSGHASAACDEPGDDAPDLRQLAPAQQVGDDNESVAAVSGALIIADHAAASLLDLAK
jgi:hypothetical protein